MKRKAEAQATAKCLVQAPITLFLQGAPAAPHTKTTAAQVSTAVAGGRHCRAYSAKASAPDCVPRQLQAPRSDAHQGAAAGASDTFSRRAVACAAPPCIQEQGKRSGLTGGQPRSSSPAGLRPSTTAPPEATVAACSAGAAASSRAASQEALAVAGLGRSPSAALGAGGLLQAGRQAAASEAASPAHSGLAGPSAGSARHGPATVGNAYEAEALPAPSTANAFG